MPRLVLFSVQWLENGHRPVESVQIQGPFEGALSDGQALVGRDPWFLEDGHHPRVLGGRFHAGPFAPNSRPVQV
jgi:hypothetical protein